MNTQYKHRKCKQIEIYKTMYTKLNMYSVNWIHRLIYHWWFDNLFLFSKATHPEPVLLLLWRCIFHRGTQCVAHCMDLAAMPSILFVRVPCGNLDISPHQPSLFCLHNGWSSPPAEKTAQSFPIFQRKLEIHLFEECIPLSPTYLLHHN